MDERAVEGQPDQPEQRRMASIVAEAVAAGAAGFSTSRFLGHRLPDGRRVPGTYASQEELAAVAEALGGGLLQVVIDSEAVRSEVGLLKELSRRAGCRILFVVGVGDETRTGASVRRMFDEFAGEGLPITGMIAPRPGGLVVGLRGSLLPWRTPLWARLHRASPEERLAVMADPEARGALVAEADAASPFVSADHFFPLGMGDPVYMAGPDQSLAALAEATGETPAAYFVRVTIESGGHAPFTVRLFNRNIDAIGVALGSEYVLPGLGDAGAHVGQVMDAGWTTFWLTHWVRDRGAFTVEEGIRRITSCPADLLGLADRGRIASGARADVNVIDMATLGSCPIDFVHDLPGGAGRFVQAARGYRATIVNGVTIVRDDAHTGARPGRVLRRFRTG